MLYVIMYLLLVAHDGLRWAIGTDFEQYLTHYQSLNSFKDLDNSSMEYLYQVSVYFIKYLFNNYSAYLIFHAILIYSLYFYAVKKYALYSFIALLFLYVSMIGMLGSNRQNIALALCFFSLQFIIEKKYLNFLIIIGIAFGFHKTSIIFLPVLFLNRPLSNKAIIVGIIITTFLSFFSYFSTLFETFTTVLLPSLFENKADFYLASNDQFGNSVAGTIFGIGRKLFPLLILFYFKSELKSNKYYNVIFNITFISLLMYIAFNNNLQFLVGRLTIYYSIFECIVFSWLFVVIRRDKPNLLILFLFFAYSIILFYRSIAMYPEIFIPYHSIFEN